jgi:phosphomannomutase
LNFNPEEIGGFKVTGLNTTDGYNLNWKMAAGLLIRFSGRTKMRVYCETTEEKRIPSILDDGLKIAGLK